MFAAHLQTQPLQTGQHKNVFSLKSIFCLTVQWKHKSSVSKNYVQIKKKGIELELDGEKDNYVNDKNTGYKWRQSITVIIDTTNTRKDTKTLP